jgi:hypothetical protein
MEIVILNDDIMIPNLGLRTKTYFMANKWVEKPPDGTYIVVGYDETDNQYVSITNKDKDIETDKKYQINLNSKWTRPLDVQNRLVGGLPEVLAHMATDLGMSSTPATPADMVQAVKALVAAARSEGDSGFSSKPTQTCDSTWSVQNEGNNPYPVQQYYVKRKKEQIESKLRRDLDYKTQSWDEPDLIQAFVRKVKTGLPELLVGWSEVIKQLVQRIHTGRMAFTAACLSQSELFSMDWKLENWGYRELDSEQIVTVNLEDKKLQFNIDKMGVCLIDHEYVEINKYGEDQLKMSMQQYGHELYSDGDNYLSTIVTGNGDRGYIKSANVIVNPYQLPRTIIEARGYPFVVKFNNLPTGTDRASDRLDLKETFIQKVSDLQEAGWLLPLQLDITAKR